MTTPSITPSDTGKPRDAGNWAQRASSLQLGAVPSGAINLNVTGKHAVSPLQGFGQMWQKTYLVRLSGATITPQKVIRAWKADFSRFWPKGNRFYGPLTGIAPGEVGLINMNLGPAKLSTGVLVLYSDEESFTFMTPQGHVFAGWITFSAYEEDGATVAQAQVLIRANDPIYELGFRFGGGKNEDKFWEQTLLALAASFGVKGHVTLRQICVDPKVQWSQAKNIWHNAGIRTTIYLVMAPVRAPIRWIRRRGRKAER